MTYHMEKTMSWLRSMELKPSKGDEVLSMQFPWKLWQAVNSPDYLLVWNDKGTGFSVNASEFEASVMQTNPGLVEISTFANFRRQMREYGFDWGQCKETGDFSFSHPCFVRGRKDLIQRVVTRRKSKYVGRREASGSASRRSTRQGRSHVSLVPARKEPINVRSLSKGSALRMVPEPASSSQLRSTGGHGYDVRKIGSIRLRHLAPKPQPVPARVEQWINLDPSSSSCSGSGVPAPALSGRQVNWFDPAGNDAERSKEEDNSWWSECFPWILQQDTDLCRQFEIDNLSSTVFQQSHEVGIPLHFYSDSFNAMPAAGLTTCTPTYHRCRNLTFPAAASGGLYGHGSVSGSVIEIKPIPDDEEFPDA